MSTKFTMTVSEDLFESWEQRSRSLGIPRNSYITLMVKEGERSFLDKDQIVRKDTKPS